MSQPATSVPRGQVLALEAPPPKMRKVAPTPVFSKGVNPMARNPIQQKQRRPLEDSARKDDAMQKKIKQQEMKKRQADSARKQQQIRQKEQADSARKQKERMQKERMRRPVSSMKVRRTRMKR
jgi:hypothetical protein